MFYLKRNLPAIERTLRIVLAAGIAIAALSMGLSGGKLFAAYGSAAMLVATALVGFCPACWLVGRKPVSRAP